jgi:drug/metabolite transporter (DMT)-like permease
VADVAYIPGEVGRERRPAIGYAMVISAALLFALNGTVSKVVLQSGISSLELTQVRATGAFLGFALVLALTRRESLRLTRREVPYLIAFGIALLIEYIAPILIALWAWSVFKEPIRRRIWVALVLAVVGLAVVVEVWSGLSLDGVGVTAALAAAVAYAVYVLMAEHAVRWRDPASLTAYGFLFAALFWAAVQPLWRFPAGRLDDSVSLLGDLERFSLPVWLLLLYIVVAGTMITFLLVAAALRHISATRVGIVAMLEPVAASAVAFLWLGESFGPAQLLGGGIVLVAILLAQTAR